MNLDNTKRNSLTYEEWLNSKKQLPEGFKDWVGAYGHWERGNSISWAIFCFMKNAPILQKGGK